MASSSTLPSQSTASHSNSGVPVSSPHPQPSAIFITPLISAVFLAIVSIYALYRAFRSPSGHDQGEERCKDLSNGNRVRSGQHPLSPGRRRVSHRDLALFERLTGLEQSSRTGRRFVTQFDLDKGTANGIDRKPSAAVPEYLSSSQQLRPFRQHHTSLLHLDDSPQSHRARQLSTTSPDDWTPYQHIFDDAPPRADGEEEIEAHERCRRGQSLLDAELDRCLATSDVVEELLQIQRDNPHRRKAPLVNSVPQGRLDIFGASPTRAPGLGKVLERDARRFARAQKKKGVLENLAPDPSSEQDFSRASKNAIPLQALGSTEESRMLVPYPVRVGYRGERGAADWRVSQCQGIPGPNSSPGHLDSISTARLEQAVHSMPIERLLRAPATKRMLEGDSARAEATREHSAQLPVTSRTPLESPNSVFRPAILDHRDEGTSERNPLKNAAPTTRVAVKEQAWGETMFNGPVQLPSPPRSVLEPPENVSRQEMPSLGERRRPMDLSSEDVAPTADRSAKERATGTLASSDCVELSGLGGDILGPPKDDFCLAVPNSNARRERVRALATGNHSAQADGTVDTSAAEDSDGPRNGNAASGHLLLSPRVQNDFSDSARAFPATKSGFEVGNSLSHPNESVRASQKQNEVETTQDGGADQDLIKLPSTQIAAGSSEMIPPLQTSKNHGEVLPFLVAGGIEEARAKLEGFEPVSLFGNGQRSGTATRGLLDGEDFSELADARWNRLKQVAALSGKELGTATMRGVREKEVCNVEDKTSVFEGLGTTSDGRRLAGIATRGILEKEDVCDLAEGSGRFGESLTVSEDHLRADAAVRDISESELPGVRIAQHDRYIVNLSNEVGEDGPGRDGLMAWIDAGLDRLIEWLIADVD